MTCGLTSEISPCWMKFRIPFMMVASHILFNTTSTLVKITMNLSDVNKPQVNVYVGVFHLLDICGWLADVFIYVFLQKRIRGFLLSAVKKRSNSSISITSVDTAITRL